jgi:hypothetical protein
MMDEREIEALRAKVRNRGKSMTLDSIAFGAGLSTSWLAKFAGGKIKEPRLHNYQALRAYMDRAQRAA